MRPPLQGSFPFHKPRKICKIASAAAFIALPALVFLAHAFLSYPHSDYPKLSLEEEFRRTSMTHPLPQSAGTLVNYRDIVRRDGKFNTSASDMMVFLHIQKTGGTTFEKHLLQDIDPEVPCPCESKKVKSKPHPSHKMKCECLRPGNSGHTWLFSRFSPPKWKCGLHPDWTELTSW